MLLFQLAKLMAPDLSLQLKHKTANQRVRPERGRLQAGLPTGTGHHDPGSVHGGPTAAQGSLGVKRPH